MQELPQTIIQPRKGLQFIDWKELARYRDLLYFLVRRDISVIYKQTVLGFAWAIIRPMFSMLIFSVVFGRLAKVPSDGIPYPVFSYAALVPWSYFSSAMVSSTQSLIANTNMLTKVYFPRLLIPMTPVLSGLMDFTIALLFLGGFMSWYGIVPGVTILFLPILIVLMIMTATGAGVWLSSLAIQFRDVKHAVQFFSQILLYAAPVVWPASLIPQQYRLLYGLYPMAGVVEGFRAAILGKNPMPWDLIGMGFLSAFLLLFTGSIYFKSRERFFADVA